MAAGHLIVVTKGLGKRFTMWAFDFGPPPDAFLAGIGIEEADASDLAGLPPPMSEAGALAAVEKAATEAVAADRFSDVVLVARNGKTLLHRAWDLASREHGVANRPDTKFNLGSINVLFTFNTRRKVTTLARLFIAGRAWPPVSDKPLALSIIPRRRRGRARPASDEHTRQFPESAEVLFTKVAVGQLVQKGRLCLDDTVGKHLPDYPNPGARKATVTSSFPSEGALVLVRAALEAAPGG